MATKQKVVSIDTLKMDDHNFNRGTEKGEKLMRKSFTELGAGRSVLLDKDDRLIAGNKSAKMANETGIRKVRIIETDGTELIAVKRTDISLDSKKGRQMALADNATTQANLNWDKDNLQVMDEQFGIDIPDWGVQLTDDEQQQQKDAENADARDNSEKDKESRDPKSEIIVASVSLFGRTEDMILCQQLTMDETDKLLSLIKTEGAGKLIKRLIDEL